MSRPATVTRLGGATVREAAVVDVGSNSVRLVIYRIEGRAILPVFNDRVSAGLGEDLASSGRLSPGGVVRARSALARFRLILDARHIHDIIPVATAAVRDARDGAEFAEDVARLLGRPLRIVTGSEEGRLSALGVLAGDPSAEGLVGDLGGSSLELASITGGEARPGVTLRLGPLAVRAKVGDDLKKARRHISSLLEHAIPRHPSVRFFAVGGAWRNIARVDMQRRGHPLRVLHQYAMAREELSATLAAIVAQKPGSLAAMTGVSRRRAEMLPLTALVLEQILLDCPHLAQVVVSSQGLREGILYAGMTSAETTGDPLVAGLDALARSAGGDQSFANAVERWLTTAIPHLGPAFGLDRDPILFAAACRVADFAARLHPDHRAEIASRAILVSPVVGVSHPERVFLSHVMHYRYSGRNDPAQGDALAAAGALLTPGARMVALRLGLTIRLAAELSARTDALLDQTRLLMEGDALVLSGPRRLEPLLGEIVEKRLEQLAGALGVRARIAFS